MRTRVAAGDGTAPPSGGAAGRARVPAGDGTAPPSGGAAGRARVPAGDGTAPPSGGAAGRARVPAGDDLRLLGEAIATVVVTWLLLGWIFDRAITQADGTVQWVPYLRSSLAAGADWTDHLYRFGVIGGSAMHDAAGTLPLVQVCAALGLRATTTANVLTVFLQVSLGFSGALVVRGLAGAWRAEPALPGTLARIVVIWACAFAPWLGWRLAYGHENLVLGLLPLAACAGLIAQARRQPPSWVALVFATWCVWNGLSGLGAQLVVDGVVFGGPIVLALALEGRATPRWSRVQLAIACALVAGVLITLPRLAGMIAHVTSDDFARSGSLTYSLGAARWRDWLTSLPWTTSLASPGALPLHEANVPVGPLLLLLALWPAAASRRLLWTLGGCAVLAILFASDVPPVSWLLLHVVPPLGAFRVPSRALLPVLALATPIALAAWHARAPSAGSRQLEALGLLAAVGVVAGGRFVPGGVREVVAVALAITAVALVRWRPELARRARVGAWLGVLAALGVGAFDERFPRQIPHERIEDGPRALHDQLVAAAPELASPLVRIELLDPPRPYDMSTGFAAGVSTLDGAWYPTRRFLDLLGALAGTPVDSTVGIFQLGRSRAFGVLQQLYDVRYVLARRGDRDELSPLPPTPGAAWFPARVETIADGAAMARALAAGARPAEVAWVLAADVPAPPPPPSCAGAVVRNATVDARGQEATFVVDTPARCTLVVATSYVHTLHATTIPGGSELAVFPIDVALTGIDVPAGHPTIRLAPRAVLPWWARLGFARRARRADRGARAGARPTPRDTLTWPQRR